PKPGRWHRHKVIQQQRPSTAKESLGGGDETRLLIHVEDNPDDLMFFHRALQRAGNRSLVRSAVDGTKAIEMLLHLEPEIASVCLVSDSKLADMSGVELLTRVREMALSIPVKFVFLSGSSQPS